MAQLVKIHLHKGTINFFDNSLQIIGEFGNLQKHCIQ